MEYKAITIHAPLGCVVINTDTYEQLKRQRNLFARWIAGGYINQVLTDEELSRAMEEAKRVLTEAA